MRPAKATAILLGLMLVGAAPGTAALAAPPPGATTAAQPSNPDPWQRFNRAGFAVHQFLDRWFLRPVAMAYQHVTPSPVRQGVHNFLGNLGEPVVAANDLMQGRVSKAGLTTARFVTNSTVGVAGLFDVARHLGAPHHDNSFGLTLGRAHVASGPYLFVPLMGPSTVRDLFGAVVDSALDPLHWVRYRSSVEVNIGRIVVGGLDVRARIDPDLRALLADATDPYATLRSVYLQNRQSEIEDNGAATPPALPDFGEPIEAPPTPSSASPAAPAPASAPEPAAATPPAAGPPAPPADASPPAPPPR